uniref:Uncharacterized protein n=1 Tax=Sus scrofa TaxID=9823 RepID=A0A8D0NRS1_PIG
MGPRMFRLFLLGVFTVLFMNEGDRVLTWKWFRFCNACDFYDGFTCLKPQKSCSKFNLFFPTACTTDHFYFYHRRTGRYFYRYSKLSCRPCEAGMSQLFHDLLRETHCCLKDKCNDVEKTLDIFKSPR